MRRRNDDVAEMADTLRTAFVVGEYAERLGATDVVERIASQIEQLAALIPPDVVEQVRAEIDRQAAAEVVAGAEGMLRRGRDESRKQ